MAVAAAEFELRLERALERVRVVLGTEKSNAFAGQVHHQYQDKYSLAEQMTNAAVASQLNCLCALGLTAEAVEQLKEWSAHSAVSFRLRTEERYTYDREETREVENPTKRVEELSVGGAVRSAWSSKVVHTVVEHFWRYEASYELLALRGVGAEACDRIPILSRTGHEELKTSTKSPPKPDKAPSNLEVNVTWLFRQVKPGAAAPSFRVDRDRKGCHTPRRNPDIEAALDHFSSFGRWALNASRWLKNLLLVQPDPTKQLDLSAIDIHTSLLIPVLPLLQDGAGGSSLAVEEAVVAEKGPPADLDPSTNTLACVAPPDNERASSTLTLGSVDLNQLLGEEQRALRERRAELERGFPSGAMVASLAEASLVMMLQHCNKVCCQWAQAMDYLERMLCRQLIAAIGKEVSPADFAEYMRFHYRKLFAEAYMPSPFCFAVRRSEGHTPEGTLSIEEEVVGPGGDGRIAAPVTTLCCKATGEHPMEFALNASTSVAFQGDRYLHAWLSHQFSGESGARASLVAKARQFSSMLVLVGRIASASTFQPQYAAIIQNKDELTIPLDLSTIPTPQEFKDAIESLSPEQQAFATAFRQMQLESTLFGVLVIHIKPQLERVLNLQEDSLTKEIKLTQELMQLFIKYQVPSDLLAFDSLAGGMEVVGATAAERLAAVRGHVSSMNSMIEASKQEEIQERRMEARYDHPLIEEDQDKVKECEVEDDGLSGFFGKKKLKKKSKGARPAGAALSLMSAGGAECADAEVALAPAPVAAQRPQAQAPGAQEDGAQAQALASAPRDWTQVPRELDERFEELDSDGALRPTIISAGEQWTKRAQKALLSTPTTSFLGKDEQKSERDAAFDLLDALTKSGAVPISHASLHIVVAATHCFDKTVTDTVVQDNMNPIEKVERSTLIMAATVHKQPAAALIKESQLTRVMGSSPQLFLADS